MSSSYLRHLPNTDRHSLIPLAILSAEVLNLQVLMVLAAVESSVEFQQVQASLPDFLRHSSSFFVNAVITGVHFAMAEVSGWGRLLVSHAFLTFSLHFFSVSVRLFICLAPELVVLPAQLSADSFPPPACTNRVSAVRKTFFLPDFLLPVLFCRPIREFCLT